MSANRKRGRETRNSLPRLRFGLVFPVRNVPRLRIGKNSTLTDSRKFAQSGRRDLVRINGSVPPSAGRPPIRPTVSRERDKSDPSLAKRRVNGCARLR